VGLFLGMCVFDRGRRAQSGFSLLEVVLTIVVGALLVLGVFVGFQTVFNKAQTETELASLRSLGREAQALLALSGADRWDTQAGLDAVLGAIEDTPGATSFGTLADSGDGLVPVEGDVWPETGEIGFIRTSNTLVLVGVGDTGWNVVVAPPVGPILGGTVPAGLVEGNTPTELVVDGLVPGVTVDGTPGPTEPPTTTTTEPEPVPFSWVQSISSQNHSCGLAIKGGAWCWGDHSYGRLGDGTASEQNTPSVVANNHVFKEIVPGNTYVCGLDTAGKAWCWGENGYGQLGDNTTTNRPTPVEVSGNHIFTQIVAGNGHTCGLDLAGKAWCWGLNGNRQLGDNTTTNRYVPTVMAGNYTFMYLSAGANHTCGLDFDGKAWCWGQNNYGRLGNGTTVSHLTPVAVSGNRTYTQLTAGYEHTCGLDTAGKAWCWGRKNLGQLGSGTAGTQSPSPEAVAGNRVFVELAVRHNHSCGLDTAGKAWCWGQNQYGQLGDNSTSQRTTPVVVSGNKTFSQISVGWEHSCAVDEVGEMWCWGRGASGRLGNGTTSQFTVPTIVTKPVPYL